MIKVALKEYFYVIEEAEYDVSVRKPKGGAKEW
jgi:hypothetical protein